MYVEAKYSLKANRYSVACTQIQKELTVHTSCLIEKWKPLDLETCDSLWWMGTGNIPPVLLQQVKTEPAEAELYLSLGTYHFGSPSKAFIQIRSQ